MDGELLSRVVLGITVQDWGILLAVWVGVSFALFFLKWLVVGRVQALAKRTNNNIDDMIAAVLKGTRKVFLAAVALLIAVQFVADDARAALIVRKIVLIGTLIQAGLWGNSLIRFGSNWYIDKESEDGQAQITAVNAVALVARIVFWAILLILALDNFGVDITTLVAGLGIGGIAIALAVQSVLQDILAYISIVVDKPFVNGDFLKLGDYAGSVEHIGIKTTRLRSLSGEQLILSNTDLLDSRISNFKRMYERRAAFAVGVTYDTPREQLKAIPAMITEIVESLEDVRFDRSHLKSFDASAITFETVYYVTKPEYALYMDRQQFIYLSIHEAFERAGIEFAFPTQSIHIESMPEVSAKASE